MLASLIYTSLFRMPEDRALEPFSVQVKLEKICLLESRDAERHDVVKAANVSFKKGLEAVLYRITLTKQFANETSFGFSKFLSEVL